MADSMYLVSDTWCIIRVKKDFPERLLYKVVTYPVGKALAATLPGSGRLAGKEPAASLMFCGGRIDATSEGSDRAFGNRHGTGGLGCPRRRHFEQGSQTG